MEPERRKPPELYAVKIVERANLCSSKEALVVSEIGNMDLVQSQFATRLKKAIKTDSRYYIFMEYCNGNDLKELMELRQFKIAPETIQKIMS